MGYLCELRCSSCGYRKALKLGCGRKDYNPRRIYSHFDLMEVWQIKVIALEKEARFLQFRYRLGRCKDCGQYLAVPQVSLSDGTEFHGKKCVCDMQKEHEIELLAEEGTEVICPECGRIIHPTQRGLWD